MQWKCGWRREYAAALASGGFEMESPGVQIGLWKEKSDDLTGRHHPEQPAAKSLLYAFLEDAIPVRVTRPHLKENDYEESDTISMPEANTRAGSIENKSSPYRTMFYIVHSSTP